MAGSPGGIEVGRVSVRVVPDTGHLFTDLTAALKRIEKEAVLSVRAELDTTGLSEPLTKERERQKNDPLTIPTRANTDALSASIRAEAAKINKSVQLDIPVTAEGEKLRQEIAAQVKLIEEITKLEIPVDLADAAALRNKMALELDLLKSMAARANPTVDIHTELNDASVAKTTAEISALRALTGPLNSGLSAIISNFSLIGAGAGILSLALIPLGAVIGGLVLALAAPLAIVAGGVTIFGFLAGFAATGTLAQIKAIDTAQSHLGTLTKGTAAYAAAAADLKAKQDALTPAQKRFAAALEGLKGAFHDPRLSAALLKPLTDVMLLLADVLPKLSPIIGAVSGVFDDLVKQMGRLVNSPGFKGFVKAFAHDLGRDLKAFAKIAGNIFIGLGGLFGVLDDTLSQGVLKGLEKISGKFADFGRNAKDNKGLKSFVGYVKQNMPKVGQLIGNVFGLIGDIFDTLAPLGSGVLDVLDGLTGALGKLGDVSGPLAASLAGIGLGAFFGGPEVGLAIGAVIALAAGFKALYDNSKPLRKVIHDLGDYFTQTWLPLIKKAATDVVPAFKSAIKDVSDTIRNNQGLFEVLGKVLVALGSAAIIGAIEQTATSIRLIGKAFKFGTAAVKLWANVMLTIFQLIIRGVGLVAGAVLSQFGTIVDAAAAAFGWMPGIGGKVKAAQKAFHDFTANVAGKINGVGKQLADLQRQINAIGKPKPHFHIDSNTLDLIKRMHELQAFKFADKNLKITVQVEQQIERVTGPGGGMQRPTGNGDTRSGSGGGGTTINVGKVEAHDYHDFLRQLAAQGRARAGGGVVLAGAR